MLQKINSLEWNEWLNITCWAGLVVTFVMLPWYWTPVMWAFQWAVWMAWVAIMRAYYPKEIEAFFAYNMKKHFPNEKR